MDLVHLNPKLEQKSSTLIKSQGATQPMHLQDCLPLFYVQQMASYLV